MPLSLNLASSEFLNPTAMNMAKRYVWLDVDPVSTGPMDNGPIMIDLDGIPVQFQQGHDDATAILLAIHCTNIHLLGVSTVSPIRLCSILSDRASLACHLEGAR